MNHLTPIIQSLCDQLVRLRTVVVEVVESARGQSIIKTYLFEIRIRRKVPEEGGGIEVAAKYQSFTQESR